MLLNDINPNQLFHIDSESNPKYVYSPCVSVLHHHKIIDDYDSGDMMLVYGKCLLKYDLYLLGSFTASAAGFRPIYKKQVDPIILLQHYLKWVHVYTSISLTDNWAG